MLRPQISAQDVQFVAQHGAPLLLQALGRLYGLGPMERAALGGDSLGVPAWTRGLLGVAVGFVGGARVQKRWPQYVPTAVAGR